jgi:hypothetical protein
MTIELIRLHRLNIPLVRPFRTSFGTETVREVILVDDVVARLQLRVRQQRDRRHRRAPVAVVARGDRRGRPVRGQIGDGRRTRPPDGQGGAVDCALGRLAQGAGRLARLLPGSGAIASGLRRIRRYPPDRVGRRTARRGRRLHRRWLPADQAEDRARVGHRTSVGSPESLAGHPSSDGREPGLRALGRPASRAARRVRTPAARAAAVRGGLVRPARHRSAWTNRSTRSLRPIPR